MGCDAAGNRYYENRVDYPFGQHRWVEPGDIHNFDSTSIPPEWHGWMVSMHDDTPSQTEEYIEEKIKHIEPMCKSDANIAHNVGHQEELFNFHHLHNQSQVRSRGYGIGNLLWVFRPLPRIRTTHNLDLLITSASIEKTEYIGELPNNRPYKSEKWRKRLMTPEEKEAEKKYYADVNKRDMEKIAHQDKKAIYAPRGAGTVLRKRSA